MCKAGYRGIQGACAQRPTMHVLWGHVERRRGKRSGYYAAASWHGAQGLPQPAHLCLGGHRNVWWCGIAGLPGHLHPTAHFVAWETRGRRHDARGVHGLQPTTNGHP